MANCNRCCQQCLHKLCTRKVPIFSSLSRNELEKIAERVVHRSYEKGELILKEGDRPEYLVILNEGTVKAFKYTPQGREQILYVFSEGDFFGEQYLLYDQQAAYYVETLDQVNTCILYRQDLQQLLMEFPDISIKMIGELGKRITRLEDALQSIGVRSVDARISSLLLEFAEKYGTVQGKATVVRLPLSREGMANYLGIARETVSRKLGQLEAAGAIASVSPKEIRILDKSQLISKI